MSTRPRPDRVASAHLARYPYPPALPEKALADAMDSVRVFTDHSEKRILAILDGMEDLPSGVRSKFDLVLEAQGKLRALATYARGLVP